MTMKRLTAFIFSFTVLTASSQTLFTYGSHKADAGEFLRAFNKNNQVPAGEKEKAVREYLDLYINSRLKIREAFDRGYDTLPHIKNEIESLRNQVIENYMSDPMAIDRLTKEAFMRSQKDIHAAHIFISFRNSNGAEDRAAAKTRLAEVEKRLARKEDFMAIARLFSDDPSAKQNGGDMNYITVFTLPYEFENTIYGTAPGQYSKSYESKAGYHIFKNLGERKALGKVKVQQILLAFPPGIDEPGKKRIARTADSIYRRIQAGDDFGKLAAEFSNDYLSAATQGNIPDIAVGQFDPVFEKTAWSLKNGAVSKPFATSHGYHIIKKISSTPIVTNVSDETTLKELGQKVRMDDRWQTAKDFIYESVKKNPGIKKAAYREEMLWALRDSLFDRRPAGIGKDMNLQSALYTIGDTTIRVSDWFMYGQAHRHKADRSGPKPWPVLMEEFINHSLYQYYRTHLEDYNIEFRHQMQEFRDGNLFFEIMQREIWNKAQADSAALVSLYEKNSDHYKWQPSADAVIFFCANEAVAKTLREQLGRQPGSWKSVAASLSEKVVADSSRYEWPMIPGLGNDSPRAGTITAITENQSDKTASFAYIFRVYPQPETRSFNEAKGLVMNDYQELLEKEWIERLKKKYPVSIDEKVLDRVIKGN